MLQGCLPPTIPEKAPRHTKYSCSREFQFPLETRCGFRYRPLSIEVETRIVGLTYNPFDRYSVRVEVGDYVPNLLAAETERLEGIRQEFRAANGRMESKIESVEGGLSELTQTISGFDFRIESAEQSTAELSLKVNGFDTRIANAEGSISTLSQTVSGFNTRITDAEGSVSQLSQTVSGFSTRISDVEGNMSTLEQTANKISWLVKSGTSATNFTLTDRAISLVASNIDLSGYVTFTNLKTSGQTTTTRKYHDRND